MKTGIYQNFSHSNNRSETGVEKEAGLAVTAVTITAPYTRNRRVFIPSDILDRVGDALCKENSGSTRRIIRV
jgi:hypothetical protein